MHAYEFVHVEGKRQFAGVSSFVLLCGFTSSGLGPSPLLLLSYSICQEMESYHLLFLLKKEVGAGMHTGPEAAWRPREGLSMAIE